MLLIYTIQIYSKYNKVFLQYRHNECSRDVAVLDEALAEGHIELICTLERRRPGGVRDGHDDVDVVVRHRREDLAGQLGPHVESGLIHSHSIHHLTQRLSISSAIL